MAFKKKQIILEPVPKNCPFCKKSYEPSFKNHKELAYYLTDRAKILGRARTGICAKHQRALTKEIKRGRFLGLLPFTPKI